MPSDQVVVTLICTALAVLLSLALGALQALHGDGRHLCIAAVVAIALAVVSLGCVVAGPSTEVSDLLAHGLNANHLNAPIIGYLAGFTATMLGWATCGAALVRSLRAGQRLWVV